MDLFTPDRARKRLHSFRVSKSALRSANGTYILYLIFSFLFLFFLLILFILQLFIRARFQAHIVY